MHLGETSINHIPCDLLTIVYRIVGAAASLKALPSNSKLHRAWQAAVENATIKLSALRADDVNILAKLVNLSELTFEGAPDDSEQTGPLVMDTIVVTSSQLMRLKSISLVNVPDGFQVLRSIAGIEDLARRLEALKIHDDNHDLDDDDLLALRRLTALRTLNVAVQSVYPSHVAPSDLGQQVSLLQDLELTTDLNELSELAVFPGSLTSLTSLSLYVEGEVDAADVEDQEQLLKDAVRKLTGLRRLYSNCCLASEEGQREVLAALNQLTHLELVNASPDESNLPFIMLPELPELVTLIVPDHAARDFLTHPSLQHLEASTVYVPDEWRGKTADACKLQHLILDPNECYNTDDEVLEPLPLLPDVRNITLYVYADNNNFLGTAALLRRQASRLERLQLNTFEGTAFEEALPRELPVCRELQMLRCSRHTLQLLAMCSMPQLEKLTLCVLAGIEHAADLAWLRSCPCLRKVSLSTGWREPVSDDVRAQVAQMMEGSGVELVWG